MLAVAFQHGHLRCRAFHAARHPQRSGEALARLCAEPDVQAVIVGQPQLTPAEKLACWKRFNRAPEWLPLACVRRCGP